MHDARFDPAQRLALLADERVNVLCMAPTEYRVIAKRVDIEPVPGLRTLVAAGEALNPEVLRAFRDGTGIEIRDGYGQTETGQLTANPVGEPVRAGSMGLPLPGVDLRVIDGELVLADPSTDPTFFVAHLGGDPAPIEQPWLTGDRVARDDDGYLYFEGRSDDLIISAGYRIGPFEVESALLTHPAVAEARGRRRPRRRAGLGGARRGRRARRHRPQRLPRRRAPGSRQARDRPLQVPADRRLRRGAAEDEQRQGAARVAASSLKNG